MVLSSIWGWCAVHVHTGTLAVQGSQGLIFARQVLYCWPIFPAPKVKLWKGIASLLFWYVAVQREMSYSVRSLQAALHISSVLTLWLTSLAEFRPIIFSPILWGTVEALRLKLGSLSLFNHSVSYNACSWSLLPQGGYNFVSIFPFSLLIMDMVRSY